jgi:hypothetical protein
VAVNEANTTRRIVGSGFTTFEFQGHPIAWLETVADSGQRPMGGGMGGGAESIYPLHAKHAAEIAFSRVLATGTLTMTLREAWNEYAWESIHPTLFTGATSITDVYERQDNLTSKLTATMVIRPPRASVYRVRTYHGCVITGIDDSEELSVGALTIPRTITVAYTHKTQRTEPATSFSGVA